MPRLALDRLGHASPLVRDLDDHVHVPLLELDDDRRHLGLPDGVGTAEAWQVACLPFSPST